MKTIKFFIIGAAAIAGFFLSLMNGSVEISSAQVFGNLFGVGEIAIDETKRQILENIRLPRTIVAMLVGVNLSLSGAELFGIFVMMIFGVIISANSLRIKS